MIEGSGAAIREMVAGKAAREEYPMVVVKKSKIKNKNQSNKSNKNKLE
jgi:hypothetical protein